MTGTTYTGAGAPTIFEDILKQVHVLIAGCAGSGKSVVINGCIYTALVKSPSQVQFILIDPKRVELYRYSSLPHCIAYATEPGEIIAALQSALQIIDSRYLFMRDNGLLLYEGSDIYVIIDELADIMTTQKKQVAPIIQRICQIGRAARVHVIAATQCPIASVIPTPIKVNFDARLGLRTRSRQDSRNILERAGCEVLPRVGRGYWINPDCDKLINIPFIQPADIQARIDSILARYATPAALHSTEPVTSCIHSGTTLTTANPTRSTLPRKKWYEFWRV